MSLLCTWHPCQISVDCMCVGLFVGPLFCSTDVYVFFIPVPYCFNYYTFEIHFAVKKYVTSFSSSSRLHSFSFGKFQRCLFYVLLKCHCDFIGKKLNLLIPGTYINIKPSKTHRSIEQNSPRNSPRQLRPTVLSQRYKSNSVGQECLFNKWLDFHKQKKN